MDWADEGDLFESLVASERVGDWLAEACGAGAAARLPPSARLSAARALATEVSRGGAYAAEALAVCAEAALSAAAEAASGDSQPALADGLRSAAAACAKAQLAADGCSERVFALPCGASVRLREASCAGDVLGLRVWDSGPRLVAHLAQQQQLGELLGASVLELGAGVGLVGLSALLLGAGSVTLTDTAQAPGVLQLLTHNAALNTQPGSGTLARVAALDWADRNAAQQPSDVTTPPLEPGETFDIILASDVLYHAHHCELLPHVIAKRLKQPHGVAMLLVPVREEDALRSFVSNAEGLTLQAEIHREPCDAQEGQTRYEHGYARITLRWMPS